MALCYMNGEFIPRDAATLPITDLAIQRGVGVFDSIRTYRRKPFTLTAHLDRLFSSAREARIEPPVTDEALRRVIFDGISRMEGECLVRPFITGGDVNLSGTFPRARFFVLFEPLRPLPPERYAEGVLLLPLELRRSTPTTKSIDYMAPLMARGGREEVFEILYCSDGEITEATSSSFFLVHGGKILTAPLEQVLSGVTRGLVLQVARDGGFVVEERCPRLDELATASEAFIASTIKEVLPVVRVGDVVLGDGKPGPVARHLRKLYLDQVDRWLESPSEPPAHGMGKLSL